MVCGGEPPVVVEAGAPDPLQPATTEATTAAPATRESLTRNLLKLISNTSDLEISGRSTRGTAYVESRTELTVVAPGNEATAKGWAYSGTGSGSQVRFATSSGTTVSQTQLDSTPMTGLRLSSTCRDENLRRCGRRTAIRIRYVLLRMDTRRTWYLPRSCAAFQACPVIGSWTGLPWSTHEWRRG